MSVLIRFLKHSKVVLFSALLFAILLTIGCADQGEEMTIPANLTLLSRDQMSGDLMQIDIENQRDNILVSNLTEELQVDNVFARLEINDDVLSFASFDNREPFSLQSRAYLSEKNLSNGVITQTEIDILLATGESPFSVLNSDNYLIMVTLAFEENNSRLAVQLCSKNSGDCNKIEIGRGFLSRPTGSKVVDNWLLLYYQNSDQEFLVSKINLNTQSLEATLVFDEMKRLTAGSNELYVFGEETYQVFSLDDFTESRSGQNQFIFGFSGFFDSYIPQTDIIQHNISFPQPSLLGVWPGLLNLSTNAITRGSAENTLAAIEALSEINPIYVLVTRNVAVHDDIVVYPITSIIPGDNRHGIVYTTWEGEILELIELDFLPNRIIFR